MLAGKRPYDAAEPSALFKLIRTQPTPPIAERAADGGADVPPELEAIVRRLLEKEPAARYQSAEELIEALDEVCPPEEGAASAVPPARASSRGARRDAVEIVDPSDASPPPAPAAPDTVPALPLRRGPRPLLLALMGVLLGLAAVKGFAPEVWGRLGGPRPAPAGLEHVAAPVAAVPVSTLPTSTAAVAAAPAQVSAAAAQVSAAVGADAYPMRFALGEAAAAHDAKRGALALLALTKAAPEAFRDRDVIANAAAVSVTVALGEPKLADEVFAALGGPALGENGPDVLFHVTSFYGGSRGAVRATDLLAKPAVLARASPGLRIARELKIAPCRDRAALFERAASEGDDRALAMLGAMLAPECAATPGACCAPNDAKLAAANVELRRRLRK